MMLEEVIKLHRFAGISPEQSFAETGRHREAVVPPQPDELPGKMPEEIPGRGPSGLLTPNPATDRERSGS
jgi:hypothetical protein